MLDFTISPEDGGQITCHGPQPWDGAHVTDQEAARCFERLRQNMPAFRRRLSLQPTMPLRLQEIRLPHQGLGDRAVRGMVEAFIKGTVCTGVVELYKNRIGDAGAQALSVLLECCPSPGVKRLHLSHNYFSQVGVGMLLTAAARSGRYPRREGAAEAGVPLWLRVENQMCPWPVLTGAVPKVQLEKAQSLVDHLGRKIFKGMQESGVFGVDVTADGFKMFCIPRPPAGYKAMFDENGLPDFGAWEYDKSSPCSSERCCHASKHGPVVHLPYFWSQNGKSQKVPEAASLHLHEKAWRTWLPPIPIASRKRALHAIPDMARGGATADAPREVKEVPSASGFADGVGHATAGRRSGEAAQEVPVLPLQGGEGAAGTAPPALPAAPGEQARGPKHRRVREPQASAAGASAASAGAAQARRPARPRVGDAAEPLPCLDSELPSFAQSLRLGGVAEGTIDLG